MRFAGLAGVAVVLAACESGSAPDEDARSSVADSEMRQGPSSEAGQSRRLAGTPFPDAVELRLFVNTEYADGEMVFSKPNGLVLSDDQRRTFENTLLIEPVPNEMAACFVPHHFFRYYDSEGAEVGEIEVCFCCLGARISNGSRLEFGDDEMLGADYQELEDLILSMGEAVKVQC